MTVPILTNVSPLAGDEIASLCYEVHGEADKFFSLISDNCTAVNAHYAKADIDNDNITLNVVDAIGVRAVDNEDTCRNISVGLSDCQATVDGANVSGIYQRAGITVREYNGRVRIAVPNCADNRLVMWVFCMDGITEDPYTWKNFHFRMIRFVVTRGLNLDEESHGIIGKQGIEMFIDFAAQMHSIEQLVSHNISVHLSLGQFWNVPIDVVEYDGEFGGSTRANDYVVTVNYPNSPPRSFVGILSSVTWEFEKRPCIYVGNSQAGPIVEVDSPNDSVIEGEYTDYEVASMFATEFIYSHFDKSRC